MIGKEKAAFLDQLYEDLTGNLRELDQSHCRMDVEYGKRYHEHHNLTL